MELKKINEGKSKILYSDGEKLYLEFKGDVMCTKHSVQYDARIAKLRAKTTVKLYEYLAQNVQNIIVPETVNETMIKMEYATPIPLEWIPRFVAAGSVVKRFGFEEGHVFKHTVLKIDYKTDIEDYLINDDLIVEKDILTVSQLNEAKKLCYDVANCLNNLFKSKGLSLWDFKMELGLTDDGRVCLIDEISLDGMRLKDSITGSSLDKDVYRKTGDVEEVINAYEEGYRRIFG